MEHDDTGLVRRAVAGDGEAFGSLVDLHSGWLLACVARKLSNRVDAEDPVQESLPLAAYQQLSQLQDHSHFGAWLAGIADNKVRMWHRRRAVQLNWLDTNDNALGMSVAADGSFDLAEARSHVRHVLGRITPTQRQVIVHHYLKGYSYQQVADFLGVETVIIRSRLQKARKRLQQEVNAM